MDSAEAGVGFRREKNKAFVSFGGNFVDAFGVEVFKFLHRGNGAIHKQQKNKEVRNWKIRYTTGQRLEDVKIMSFLPELLP